MENNNKQKENNAENIRSVSEKWMDKIYSCLDRTESLERLAKSGYVDIRNYIDMSISEIPLRVQKNMVVNARIESLNLMIMEFQTLEISGGCVLFSEEFVKIFNNKMEELKSINSEELAYIKRVQINNNPNKPIYGNLTILTPKFQEQLGRLCELRKVIVVELKDTLFLTKHKNKVEGRL